MRETTGIDSREECRDAIERFLDRSWVLERTSIAALSRHRVALRNLDSWMQRHCVVSLAAATAKDMRALMNSSRWDAVAQGCECLVSLVASFFRSLQDTRFRSDDPIVTIIDQEMSAAAKRAVRPERAERRRARMQFRFAPVI
jgi:site-specific recombinase XerD